MGAPEEDLRYNCLGVRTPSVQVFNTVAGVVTSIGLCNCFLTLVTQGLPGVVLSTMERRFGLASTQSSWIASSYEVASIPPLLLLTFLASRSHRPRLIAAGMVLITVGCVIFILPHFLTPVYRPEGGLRDSLCGDKSGDEDVCKQGGTDDDRFYPLLILGRILHGAGSVPCMILGLTYMDDVTTRERFSTYAGVFFAMGVVGPAIGTIGGGFMLNIFTDYTTSTPEDLVPGDPRWVGAWWLPFTIGGALSLLSAWPMAGFPPDMPGAADIRMARKSEAHGKEAKEAVEAVEPPTGALVGQRLMSLFTNPPFVMVSLFIVCDTIIISGFQAFGPKFVEQQFGFEPAVAGSVFGGVLLPAGLVGTIVGGIIIENKRLSCQQILKAEAVLAAMVVVAAGALFANCSTTPFAGVNTPYHDSGPVGNLSSGCNADCQCVDLPYEPVCAHTNIRYYSPCHAGCARKIHRAQQIEYYDCACLPRLDNASAPVATSRPCSADTCRVAPLFFVLFFFSTVMMFMCMSMNMSATVRLVGANEKQMAVPIQAVFNKLLGAIPGPIAFGNVFDGACQLWTNRCGERGFCLLYDRGDTGKNMFLLTAGVKVASVIFMSVALLLYRPRSASSDVTLLVPGGKTKNEVPDTAETETDKVTNKESACTQLGISNPVYDEEPA